MRKFSQKLKTTLSIFILITLTLIVVSGCAATARKPYERMEIIKEETIATKEEPRGLQLKITALPTPAHPDITCQITSPVAKIETREKICQKYEGVKIVSTSCYGVSHVMIWTIGWGLLYPIWLYPVYYSDFEKGTQKHLSADSPPGQYKNPEIGAGGLGNTTTVSIEEQKGPLVHQPAEEKVSLTGKEEVVSDALVTARIPTVSSSVEVRSDPSGECKIPIADVLGKYLQNQGIPCPAIIVIQATHKYGEAAKELPLSEQETIEIAFGGKIDWSEGKTDLPPYLTASAQVSSTKAGEKVFLNIEVENKGKGSTYRLLAKTESKEPILNGYWTTFGKIEPGKKLSRSLTIPVPRELLSNLIPVTIKFKEMNHFTPDPINLIVNIKGLPQPFFSYSYQLFDDNSGNSVGNSDGIFQKGEAVDILLRVKNTGESLAKDVTVNLNLLSKTADITVKQGRITFDDMAPDESKTARFTVIANKICALNIVDLGLNISETSFGLKTGNTLNLKIGEMTADKVIALNPINVYVKTDEAMVRGGASLESVERFRAKKGGLIVANGQLGDWYRVDLGENRIGWVYKNDITLEKPKDTPTATVPQSATVIEVFQKSSPNILIDQSEKESPITDTAYLPYKNLLDGIRTSDFGQIEKWAEITVKDFPNSEFAMKSPFHLCILYLALESGYLSLGNSWHYGMEEAMDDTFRKYGKDHTKSDFKVWREKYYEQRNEQGVKLAKAITSLLIKDAEDEIKFSLPFNLELQDIGYLKSDIEDGSYLETKKRESLEKGTLETFYFSFWRMCLAVQESVSKTKGNLNLEGTLDRIKFYALCGQRLKILYKENKKEEFKIAAQKCLEKVLNLTKNKPYSTEREKTKELLKELEGQ